MKSIEYQKFLEDFKALRMEECQDLAQQMIAVELPERELKDAIAFIRGEAGNLANCVMYFKRRYTKKEAWRKIKLHGYKVFPEIIEQMREDLLKNKELTDVQKRSVMAEYIGMIEAYRTFPRSVFA